MLSDSYPVIVFVDHKESEICGQASHTVYKAVVLVKFENIKSSLCISLHIICL